MLFLVPIYYGLLRENSIKMNDLVPNPSHLPIYLPASISALFSVICTHRT